MVIAELLVVLLIRKEIIHDMFTLILGKESLVTGLSVGTFKGCVGFVSDVFHQHV